jgi:hypothetical protein
MYLGRRLKIDIALNPLKKQQSVTFPPDGGVGFTIGMVCTIDRLPSYYLSVRLSSVRQSVKQGQVEMNVGIVLYLF